MSHNSLTSRALITAAATTALAVGALAGSAPAFAHVHVDADDPVQGDSAIVTFQVPNESDSGSPTTALSVALPNLTSVSTAVLPGWTAKLDRDDAAGTVRSVTWSASPNNGIGADQFGLFAIRVTLPNSPTVSFPATQTYADGTVVHWDQQPLPGGGEPEHPAPMLTLAAGGGQTGSEHTTSEHTSVAAAPPETTAETPAPTAAAADQPGNGRSQGPDNVARVLAGGALLVAALGVALALGRRRA
jgi:uncharacterized protein YcnI